MTSTIPATQPSLAPYSPSVDNSGKWLLAPLQGLPFDDMVANGEGARHGGDANYYRLILIHGLFAAIAFLVLTPAAIICARFLIHGPRPRLAMWGHIGFQIGSLVCLTITFITGYFAVGKENWGKNPHHIIGATLYGAMIFQAFFGAFVRWKVNKKIREAPPLYKMLHQWLGRAIFVLGLAQIPLGLYIYGSPKTLFILYAVLAFLFLASWFTLEYLRNRGWFHHRYGGVAPAPVPDMSEHTHSEIHRDVPDVESGYSRVGMDDSPIQTPRKSRFSKISWLVNRGNSQRNTGNTIGIPYQYDGTTSMDTSRAASAQSPAIGGLAPGPGRKEEIPPVPSLPTHYERSSSSFPSAEFQQRYGNTSSLKDTALRDSTTLGPAPVHIPQHLEMPEPHIPHPSPGNYDQYPGQMQPVLGATPRSSGHSHQSYHQQPQGQYDQMLHSPIGGGGYIEGDHGFVPTPADEAPLRPLPLIPHRRERSNDSVNRLPITNSLDEFPGEGQTVTIGGGEGSGGRRGPNLAVQVKLNPDGKSVTVRRLPPEEAERERRERSRARQERALQREMEMEREQLSHRPLAGRQRQDSIDQQRRQDSMDRQREMENSSQELRSPNTSYTPSIGGQSSTIAGASGGLLGRHPEVQTPPNEQSPLGAMSPLIGMQPVTRSPIPRGALSSSQRASITSGGTAENSEIEQEIVKEQRRKKRREERAGTSQGGSGVDSGGYYGPRGPESQWT